MKTFAYRRAWRGALLVGLAAVAVATTAAAQQLTPTASQSEGPYYPVAKPADRDADLTQVHGAASAAQGEALLISGRVLDRRGAPIAGATLQIWQTDANGIYLHPRDPGIRDRDPGFQGYGEAVTAADGGYRLRTILPGLYGSRPRHIHVKVLVGEREALTTQFYFVGDQRLASDRLARGSGAPVLEYRRDVDAAGAPVWVAAQDVVLSLR